MKIVAILVAMLCFGGKSDPSPPKGLIDCGFDARDVYVCRP